MESGALPNVFEPAIREASKLWERPGVDPNGKAEDGELGIASIN